MSSRLPSSYDLDADAAEKLAVERTRLVNIDGYERTVKVIPPKPPRAKERLTNFMPSRDDSRAPGQQFMRSHHSRSAV